MTSAINHKEVTLRDGRVVLIEPATVDDAEALLLYMEKALPEFTDVVLLEPDEFKMTVEQERDWLRMREETGGLMLIARYEDEIVASLSCVTHTRRRIAHVGEIGVSARRSFWDSGIGTALMRILMTWAEAHASLKMLQLMVYSDNERAMALYRRFGFVEAGRIPGRTRFASGERKDDVIMYCDLEAGAAT